MPKALKWEDPTYPLNTSTLAAQGLTLAPGWSIHMIPEVAGSRSGLEMEVDLPGVAPDINEGDSTVLFPGGIGGITHPGPHTLENAAVGIIAAVGTAALHEAIEWVRVDGRPVAATHPGWDPDPAVGYVEGEMWEWLHVQMVDLVRRFQAAFPVAAGAVTS